MNARVPRQRPALYEVRAVWHPDPNARYTRSQRIGEFDRRSMEPRVPDKFGVYTAGTGGAWVEDHDERAQAEAHAAQLNGGQL